MAKRDDRGMLRWKCWGRGDGSGGGEWRKWYELGKCSLPLDMSNLDHLKNEITLKKNHKQKLLFKFLSYREPALKNEKDDGSE